jgi:hypothetical protein
MGLGHHIFSEESQPNAEQAWQSWLTEIYS